MRLHLLSVFVAVLLDSGAAVHRHRKAKRRDNVQHQVRQAHKHGAKHGGGAHHTATYASMKHSLDKMVERNTLAESQLSEAALALEDAILDVTAPNSTLRGVKKLPGNLSATLKTQEGKLGELFSHLKSNIAEFNKREADQKKDSQTFAERINKRLKEDKKRLEDPNLSDFDREMLVNRTRTEEHELKFWTRGRSLQHDMFHSNLKLTHGLMSRVKTVMDAYKQVLATGKLDSKLTQVLHETSAGIAPKALLQEQQVTRDVRKLEKHLKISAKLLHRA